MTRKILLALFALLFPAAAFFAQAAAGQVVSSFRMPTNPLVESFGAAPGRHWSSLALWELAYRGDITGAGAKSPVLQCFPDEIYNIGASVVFRNGAGYWVTGKTKYPVIMAAPGHENRGVFGSGVIFRRQEGGPAQIISVTRPVTGSPTSGPAIYGVTFLNQGSGTAYAIHVDFSSWDGATGVTCYSGNIFSGFSNAIRFKGTYFGAVDHESLVANNLFVSCTWAIYGNELGAAATKKFNIANNTIFGCAGGIYMKGRADLVGNRAEVFAANNIFEGCDYPFHQGSFVVWTKLSNAENAGVLFKDPQEQALGLHRGDTAARDQGADLSSTLAFNDDAAGVQRGAEEALTGEAWDIGALEFVAATPTGRRIPWDRLLKR
jgi:hypothetical protein